MCLQFPFLSHLIISMVKANHPCKAGKGAGHPLLSNALKLTVQRLIKQILTLRIFNEIRTHWEKKKLQNDLKAKSAAGPCAEHLPAWGLLNKLQSKAQ